MKGINAIITDDATSARQLLRMMLSEIAPDIHVMAEAGNLAEAVEAIRRLRPDVVFLDIEMPGKSGLDIIEVLPREEYPIEIIFTTAYDAYAVKAFRLAAVDYLLKPIREEELSEAVQKLRDHLSKGTGQNRIDVLRNNFSDGGRKQISIPSGGDYEAVFLDEIEYLEADGSYVTINLSKGGQRICSRNLKSFDSVLTPDAGFMRVHRSFLIRLDKVARFTRNERATITMQSGKVIDLARDRRTPFFQAMVKPE